MSAAGRDGLVATLGARTGAGVGLELACGPVAAAAAGSGSVSVGLAGPADAAARAGRLAADMPEDPGAAVSGLGSEFAVVAWDEAARRGFAAVDETGSQALFWHRSDEGTVRLASEPAAIVAALQRRPEPDELAVAQLLALGWLPPVRTLHRGVQRLAPGTLLELPGCTTRRWRTPRFDHELSGTPDELAQHVRGAVIAAARRAAGSEPAAVLQSGGLDSGTVVAALLQAGARPRAYAASFPGVPDADEGERIAVLRGALGLEGSDLVVEPGGTLAVAARWAARFGAPPVVLTAGFMEDLARMAARDGAAVLLDGAGGDEVFASAPARARIRRPRALLAGARRRSRAGWPPAWLGEPLGSVLADGYEGPDSGWLEGPQWWQQRLRRAELAPGLAGMLEQTRRRGALAGLRTAHPLLDRAVRDLAASIPPASAAAGDQDRDVLRAAFPELPDPVRFGPKTDLAAYLVACSRAADAQAARKLLAPGACLEELAGREALAVLAAPTGPAGLDPMRHAGVLWRAAALEIWLRIERDPASAAQLPKTPIFGMSEFG